jgi:hypothetical protein
MRSHTFFAFVRSSVSSLAFRGLLVATTSVGLASGLAACSSSSTGKTSGGSAVESPNSGVIESTPATPAGAEPATTGQ